MSPIILGALISGVVAIGSTIVNAVMTEKSISASQEQSDKNIELQKEFNESQTLGSKIQEAKDNGISPLAVLGQNASNAVVSAPQANADYSGLANFGRSLQSTFGNLANSFVSNMGSQSVEKMRNESAERINSMQISSSEKMKLQELNNSLTIANDKNSTDKEIQASIRNAQHKLEMLRSSNSLFNQNENNRFAQGEHAKEMKHAMDMLQKQLENAEKERDSRIKVQLIHEAFTTFNTMIYSASSVFGGNVSSYIDNLGKSRLGF